MAIIGLALFGSRARQDNDDDSDFDLLAITTDAGPSTVARNKFTLTLCALEHIIGRARRGDLFTLHIVSEGKVIYDTAHVFEQIADAFRYKSDYTREIKLASDFGWLLVRNCERFKDKKEFAKRLVWSTRTILIAMAANQRRPIFSAKKLSEFAGSSDILALIGSKTDLRFDQDKMAKFERFLRTFGVKEPPLQSLENDEDLFKEDRNVMGLSAICELKRSQSPD
jgi:hypothetical protein